MRTVELSIEYNISMVQVLEGSDLLSVQQGIICHQVNCIGVMGAGVALQIKEKWPNVFSLYKEECSLFASDPKKLLGHVQDVLVGNGLVVVNCYGQVKPGNGLMTDYRAWDIILDKLRDTSCFFSLDLHFPYGIGCGLAGGDWSIMGSKISASFMDSKQNVFIHRLA